MTSEDNFAEIAPILSGMERRNDFVVPDGYFDDLPMQIQSRISTGQSKNRSFFGHFLPEHAKWIVASSTLVMTVAILLIVLLPATRQGNLNLPAAQGQSSGTFDLSDYIDESSIVDVILDNQLPDPFEIADNKKPAIMLGTTEFSRDEIIDYLVETDHMDQLTHEDLGQ
jgi:hypothetical protein